MSETNLSNVLSSLYQGVSGVYENFLDYDDELSGLLSAVQAIDIDAQGESETIAYSVKPKIITLAGSTTYALEDSKIYNTVLVADTTFTLPAIEDLSILHEIILTVKFDGNPWYATFRDSSNNEISTMDGGNNYWSAGDVVQYLCRYEPFLLKWVVMPMKLY